MSFIADVTVEMPLMSDAHEAVPEAEGSMADYHREGDESGTSQYVIFVWMTGADFEEIEDAFEADDTIESFEFIAESDDRRLYRLRSIPVPDDVFLLTVFLRDHDIALQEVTRDVDGLHFRAQFPSRESLQALLDALERYDQPASVDGIYSEDPRRVVDRGLTERQWEVLCVAAEAGYFETPSEATLSEVAAEFDVSPQAVSTHLRTAVEKLVEGALEGRREQPQSA